MSPDRPYLTVVVPAHNGERVLPHTLGALAASDLPREKWELIVVDDASTDGTSTFAARYADVVVRLAGKPRGPAYARNRGVEVARGEVVVFIDSDVCVHRDTLRRFASLFASDATICAAFGSYDAEPEGAGPVSQFRNLMHHYVHHANAGEAETFWAGCGAVRTAAFAEAGMFDEWHFSRPQIEDIELGRRLRRRGHRIVLRPEIQGKHLKRWTLRDVIRTDFRHRGTPWMWLLLNEGPAPGGQVLNLRTVEKWCTALTGLALAAAAAALVLRSAWPLAASFAAFATIILLNRRFYLYLGRIRGAGFALRAIPLHLLYYTISGFSVIAGWLLHTLFGAPQPPDDVAAQAELGIETWPPGPARPAHSVWTDRDADRGRNA